MKRPALPLPQSHAPGPPSRPPSPAPAVTHAAPQPAQRPGPRPQLHGLPSPAPRPIQVVTHQRPAPQPIPPPPRHVPQPVAWTPDWDVAMCGARATAQSLHAALGVAVPDSDVLDLYWRTATDADAGATILATLLAAARHALAGHRPRQFFSVTRPQEGCGHILALRLPQGLPRHAVFDDGTRWWSWGGAYDPAVFAGAAVLEAWTVEWA